MARRGTKMTWTASGTEGQIWVPYQEMIGGQTTGAATTLVGLGAGGPVTVAEIGQDSDEVGLSALGVGATNDEFAFYIPSVNDWDLTERIYIEPHIYVDHAQAADDKLDWAIKYKVIATRPAAANSLDQSGASAISNQPSQLVVVATDLAGIVQQTGGYISGGVLTSQTGGLLVVMVATLTTADADQFGVLGTMIRYTKR